MGNGANFDGLKMQRQLMGRAFVVGLWMLKLYKRDELRVGPLAWCEGEVDIPEVVLKFGRD